MAKKAPTENTTDGEGPSTNIDTCFKVLSGIQDQIRFADAKAAFIFGINTLMFGFMTCTLASLKKSVAIQPTSPAVIVTLVALILFAGCAVATICLLIYSVMSRFGKMAPKSKLFFGHIASQFGKDYGKYVTELKAMSNDEWITEVGTQIVETSHIAFEKHSAVKKAAIISLIGLACWAVAIFSSALLP